MDIVKELEEIAEELKKNKDTFELYLRLSLVIEEVNKYVLFFR